MCIIPHFSALSPSFAGALVSSNTDDATRALASLYISSWDFDEDWYLASSPDLSDAISAGVFASAWHHFLRVGFFEGRLPVEPIVDVDWYMSQYGDVAAAILDNAFPTARDHYTARGRAEGRLPCDPGIDTEWYARRYLVGSASRAADRSACIRHYLDFGYLNGATPRPPRC